MEDLVHRAMRRVLTEAERTTADSNLLEEGPPGAGTIDLLAAWSWEVESIRLSAPVTTITASTWGANDFVGSLFMRNFVERSVRRLPHQVAMKLSAIVDAQDDLFKSITEDDGRNLASRLAEVDPPDDFWWWRRLPIAGSIRSEFEELSDELTQEN